MIKSVSGRCKIVLSVEMEKPIFFHPEDAGFSVTYIYISYECSVFSEWKVVSVSVDGCDQNPDRMSGVSNLTSRWLRLSYPMWIEILVLKYSP